MFILTQLVSIEWLSSGEALAVQQLVINEKTQEPTEAGIALLRKANVSPDEIIVGGQYSKNELQEVRRFSRSSPKNFYDSPAVEIRLHRTLSLLRVALVVTREKLD